MDPFAAALDALFLAPGSAAATYQDDFVSAAAIRVVVSQPDQSVNFGDGQVVLTSHEVQMRRSEVQAPRPGALLVVEGGHFLNIGGEVTDALRLFGDPMLDAEGLTWTCGAAPVS